MDVTVIRVNTLVQVLCAGHHSRNLCYYLNLTSYKVNIVAIPIIQVRRLRHGLVQNNLPRHAICCIEITTGGYTKSIV